MPVKTRRAKPPKKKNPVYLFSLDSTDFTGLKNNKKINIIDISNKRGLIYSGCYGGDLFIWRNDNYRRERPVKEAYELVSKIKAHNQILHLISMSPDENYFMTGATDGTVKIWRQPETAQEINELIQDLENGRTEGGNRREHPLKRNIIKAIDGSEELAICQCDAIEWSCRGRYAIFSFGGKEDEESLNDRSMIYIWDQRKREIVKKIGSKNSGITLDNFTFVLKGHPKFENYFVSGGGAGKVIIWDIQKGAIVNTFKETGIYQRDENILNEVFDGKFSTCGKIFVMSTVGGTFTIYSVFDKESYYATPVEQFFQYDKLPEVTSNIYNEKDAQLCNFDRMKYTEQPPLPIIGERYIGRFMSHEDYETLYNDRYNKFSKDQKFFENYDQEYAPYAFLNNQARDGDPNNLGNGNANRSADDDSSENSEYSEESSPHNGRNRRSMYYDPHNDEFDRESDEDFIVDSFPENVGTRRTVRRLDRSRDVDMHDRNRNANEQREARNRRFLQRNRVRNSYVEDSDSEDYVLGVVENEESEEEFNISNGEEDKEYEHKKPVNRNGVLDRRGRGSIVESDSDDEMIDVQLTNKPNSDECNPMLGLTKITVEDEGTEMPWRSYSHFLCMHSSEDFEFKNEMKGDGYRIDKEAALAMKNEDKSSLNCAL